MKEKSGRWQEWLDYAELDAALRTEVEGLLANGRLEELAERFVADLQFGTGGMREVMGAGNNRLNIYTIRKATVGVARWIQERVEIGGSLVIAYDGRRDSDRFAQEAASVAAASGVKVHLFQSARPTPMLSFAVRHLGCAAGIMITASHNPPAYNGYKVYNADGGQILPDDASLILKHMADVKDVFAIPVMGLDKARAEGLFHEVGTTLEDEYFEALKPLHRNLPQSVKDDVLIVYTPLHGTGGAVIPRALQEAGFRHVQMVREQAVLDANFSCVKSPNPEEPVAYDLAQQVALESGADVVLATDPDTDRVGVMVRDEKGEYSILSGNDIGGLLLDDYLQALVATGRLPRGATMVTTNVTSDFGEAVARAHSVATERTLTGFKFIGAKIKEYEEGRERTFVFGYEESVGYLALPFARDKDAVQGCILVANMVARWKAEGANLVQVRDRLFARLGYYANRLLGYTFSGRSGLVRMNDLMESLRKETFHVEGMTLTVIEDCLTGISHNIALGKDEALPYPASDVLKYRFASGAWVAVRPSGTEPKLKVYVGSKGANEEAAVRDLERLCQAIEARVMAYC